MLRRALAEDRAALTSQVYQPSQTIPPPCRTLWITAVSGAASVCTRRMHTYV